MGDVDEQLFLHEGLNHERFTHIHILNLSSFIHVEINTYLLGDGGDASFDNEDSVQELLDLRVLLIHLGVLLHGSDDFVDGLTADFLNIGGKHNKYRLHFSFGGTFFAFNTSVSDLSLGDEVLRRLRLVVTLEVFNRLVDVAIVDLVASVSENLKDSFPCAIRHHSVGELVYHCKIKVRIKLIDE
jgi:hypothetical protein